MATTGVTTPQNQPPTSVLFGSLHAQGASAQTQTVVSSRFKIYAPIVGLGKFQRVGVTSSFGLNETKTIEVVRGLGYGDQIAELVPNVTEPMKLSVKRTALYLANVMQMFGYHAGVSGCVRSLRHHKWPFDIRTDIVFSEIATEQTPSNATGATLAAIPAEGGLNNLGSAPGLYCVQTLYVGCWMESCNTSFEIGTAAVAEDVSIVVTDVFDNSGSQYGEFINSGNNSTDITGRSLLYVDNNTI